MRLAVSTPPTFRCQALPRRVVINVRRRPDPTHTGMIRQAFEAEVNRRFASLLKALQAYIERTRLGGEPMATGIVAQADGAGFGLTDFDASGRFLFPRSVEVAADFMRWLRAQSRRDILGITEGTTAEAAARRAWSNVYIDSAYSRGIRQAGANLKRGGAKVADSWAREAFNRPIHADRVGLIYSRTFTELEHVTEVMAQAMREVLALGMAEGRNPLDIARGLRDRVEHIGITRARLIARTEVIAAHAEASLNGYEEAGIVGVEVDAEWSTAGDDRVCPECASMEGKLFTLAEARGMIPAHPGCRCAFLPAVQGGSGITLNWVRHAPRTVPAQRFRGPQGNLARPPAHHCAGGHRGGRRPQRAAAPRR